MRQTQRRDRGGALRPTMRCTNNQCRTHRSIRRQKDFSIMLMLLADLVADYQCFKYWNWWWCSWVFGLIQGDDCRYFWVAKRDAATLIPIIQANVAPGSVIHSDEWAAYRSLSQLGYIHETVNHQHNFVDPATGAHTQLIERSWLDAKMKLLRRQRGVPGQHLQSHLDYYCWWRMRKN